MDFSEELRQSSLQDRSLFCDLRLSTHPAVNAQSTFGLSTEPCSPEPFPADNFYFAVLLKHA